MEQRKVFPIGIGRWENGQIIRRPDSMGFSLAVDQALYCVSVLDPAMTPINGNCASTAFPSKGWELANIRMDRNEWPLNRQPLSGE